MKCSIVLILKRWIKTDAGKNIINNPIKRKIRLYSKSNMKMKEVELHKGKKISIVSNTLRPGYKIAYIEMINFCCTIKSL